ncbi:MAG: prephenate dehydratase [Bacteroidota bacterium]
MNTTASEKLTSTTYNITLAPPLRVSIQGYQGAFHEVAARQFFTARNVEIVPAHTFEEVVEQITAGKTCDLGLMAIENTLAGSIMANYELLHRYDVRITGEVYLRIRQNLVTLPGVKMEDLREVHSHHMAIAQCRRFFRDYPHIRLVEAADTALSARHIKEKSDPQRGAISSNLAAELYGLQVLAAGIETNKLNHTRFLVLESGKYMGQDTGNKVSLSFAVSHESGSLYRVLTILAAYQINLTKIQSTPIVGQPWQYRFFVDFIAEGDISWEQAIEGIRPITKDLRVLGVYEQGEKP